MKVNGKITKRTDKEYYIMLMATFMKLLGRMVILKVKVIGLGNPLGKLHRADKKNQIPKEFDKGISLEKKEDELLKNAMNSDSVEDLKETYDDIFNN